MQLLSSCSNFHSKPWLLGDGCFDLAKTTVISLSFYTICWRTMDWAAFTAVCVWHFINVFITRLHSCESLFFSVSRHRSTLQDVEVVVVIRRWSNNWASSTVGWKWHTSFGRWLWKYSVVFLVWQWIVCSHFTTLVWRWPTAVGNWRMVRCSAGVVRESHSSLDVERTTVRNTRLFIMQYFYTDLHASMLLLFVLCSTRAEFLHDRNSVLATTELKSTTLTA